MERDEASKAAFHVLIFSLTVMIFSNNTSVMPAISTMVQV